MHNLALCIMTVSYTVHRTAFYLYKTWKATVEHLYDK